MRSLFTILTMVVLYVTSWAQAPQKMSYQAVIRNSSGALVTSKNIGMQISILKDSANGLAIYIETHKPTTNANGLASLEIGGGTIVSGNFAAINWGSGSYFLKTETDPFGGTSYTMGGTTQFLSVPYALHSKTAESIVNGSGIFNHYIGELFGGGIVVAVWKEAGVEKGLIMSLMDLSTSPWSNINSLIGSNAQDSFDGRININAIISQSGHSSSAAKLCDSYTNSNNGTGIHTDWYLPSIWELHQCRQASPLINVLSRGYYGLQLSLYWSSTEAPNPASGAFCSGIGGNISDGNKLSYMKVRAVRRF